MICRMPFSCRYARIWTQFEHGEVDEERVHDAEVAQDKAYFEDKLARKEANFQIDPEASGVLAGTPQLRSGTQE